jgi:hypothetical protein
VSLTVREDHRLRVFESRVLRGTFTPIKGEIVGSWRKLHNKELHAFRFSPSIIRTMKSRRMKWA